MTTAPVEPGPEVFPDPDAPPVPDPDPDLDPDVFPPDPAEQEPQTDPV
jgi:hypothetical protein